MTGKEMEYHDYRDKIHRFVREHEDTFSDSDVELLTDRDLYFEPTRTEGYEVTGEGYREHLALVFDLFATYTAQEHAKAMRYLTLALAVVAALQLCVAASGVVVAVAGLVR